MQILLLLVSILLSSQLQVGTAITYLHNNGEYNNIIIRRQNIMKRTWEGFEHSNSNGYYNHKYGFNSNISNSHKTRHIFLGSVSSSLSFVRKLTLKQKSLLSLHFMNIRGGDDNMNNIERDNDSTGRWRYSKIGFVNLSSIFLQQQQQQQQIEKQILSFDNNSYNNSIIKFIIRNVVHQLLIPTITTTRSSSSSNDDDSNKSSLDRVIGAIYAIPPSSRLSNSRYNNNNNIANNYYHEYLIHNSLQNNIINNNNNQEEHNISLINRTGDMTETIGCLVDSLIVVYDVSYQHRQNAIIRLLKGIQRQKQSKSRRQKKTIIVYDDDDDDDGGSDISDSDENYNNEEEESDTIDNNDVDLIFLATSHEAALELNAIKDILISDQSIVSESMHIVTLPKNRGETESENDNDIDLVDKYTNDIVEKLNSIKSGDDYHSLIEYPVPIGAFHKLVGAVHCKLSGTKNLVKENIIFLHNKNYNEQGNALDENIQIIGEVEPTYSDRKDDSEVIEHEITDNEVYNEYDSTVTVIDNYDDLIDLDEKQVSRRIEENLDHHEDKDDGGVTSNTDTILESKERQNEFEDNLNQKAVEVLQDADTILNDLEIKQNEVLIEIETKMPILQFGKEANRVLKRVANAFEDRNFLNHGRNDFDKEVVENKKYENIAIVNSRIHKLFQSQLQSLREYYGRRYESILSNIEEEININTDEVDEKKIAERRKKLNATLTDAAKRSTEGFRVAAMNAIPDMFKDGRLGGHLNYSFDDELDGLIRDMMHATSSIEMLQEEWEAINDSVDDEDDIVSTGLKRRRGPVKWYEKIAARILVLGVNYLQGWLALQGLRKAASDRDRLMPKFPLF